MNLGLVCCFIKIKTGTKKVNTLKVFLFKEIFISLEKVKKNLLRSPVYIRFLLKRR